MTGTLCGDQCTFFFLSHSILLRMRSVSGKSFVKIKRHNLCSITFFFRKSFRLWDDAGKCDTSRQAADDNIAHALCMLDNWGYKQTFRICNTFCISTATLIARTRLCVTLYLHCLSLRDWIRFYPRSIEEVDVSGESGAFVAVKENGGCFAAYISHLSSFVSFPKSIQYLLTPWSRVLEKLTVFQLVKKLPSVYGNRRFITAFVRVLRLSLSWARWIHSTPPHPIPEDPS